MKKNYTNLFLGISIFMALLIVGAFVFFFKVIQNKNEHISKVLVTLEDKMVDKKNADTLIQKLNELDLLSKEINNYFVDSTKIDTFVGYLEKLGSDNDTELFVKNVEISTSEKDTILVKISINGDFNNVMKVVYLIENSPYNINLNQVFINKEIKTIISKDKKEEEITVSIWQADVVFSILSLP